MFFDALATTEIEVANSSDGLYCINGSFVNETIGDGKYKLNGDGTAFGRTSANGKVTAYRSYIETKAPQADKMRLIIKDEIDGVGKIATDVTMESDKMYDLSGRILAQPIPGKPYILNGRICIDK